mmetsp:Transcript_97551/g.247847  ORF Transcript_97551/g.247847 Transcript_97551/m.247847 type:complete len:226 (-) Transcript_97551:333-1010(-)
MPIQPHIAQVARAGHLCLAARVSAGPRALLQAALDLPAQGGGVEGQGGHLRAGRALLELRADGAVRRRGGGGGGHAHAARGAMARRGVARGADAAGGRGAAEGRGGGPARGQLLDAGCDNRRGQGDSGGDGDGQGLGGLHHVRDLVEGDQRLKGRRQGRHGGLEDVEGADESSRRWEERQRRADLPLNAQREARGLAVGHALRAAGAGPGCRRNTEASGGERSCA